MRTFNLIIFGHIHAYDMHFMCKLCLRGQLLCAGTGLGHDGRVDSKPAFIETQRQVVAEACVTAYKSVYCTVFDSETSAAMSCNDYAIAWIDLGVKYRSLFARNERIVLNGLSGGSELGAMTAVMGPSGAGLTSLLMCFAGVMSGPLMTSSGDSSGDRESAIRVSRDRKIRTAFIGLNEKDFLIMGLTAKQNMIYASKLKNSSEEHFSHEKNVSAIMSSLMIADTIDTKTGRCSGGELKRLAIAVELTALHKPNLILCDEPTTGLDNNIAEMVMQSLKSLCQKHNISIIASIHQPNTDILQMCDKLYVLAKGGECVYWGPPSALSPHLHTCGIVLNENQVPIETLITIASKGLSDQNVRQLRDQTTRQFNHEFRDIIVDKTKPKLIKHNKSHPKVWTMKICLDFSQKIFERNISLQMERTGNQFTNHDIYGFIGLNVGQFNDCVVIDSREEAKNHTSCLDQLDSDNKAYDNTGIAVVPQLDDIIASKALSIAWIDLTLKVDKTLNSSEKVILRTIKGFVEFGSLTALMGPSGAGKTSLLRALNGMNKTLITKQSEIYLNGKMKITACFIAQDQREHIMAGMTTRQTIIYASKLKNCDTNSNVDHESIADKLMSELCLNDISAINVENCSSGQQKRIVIAMEMTAEIKPNLICVDEPTSGVDSYSAILMIKCFKRLSRKHNISMIASIHQPNLEILMLFDMLYILAKGGVAVYSGPPRGLRSHLDQCNIQCNENQISIEVLIKLSANGFSDEK
ncbi:unnamed protein product, partial [Medioppia subpectinata]